tara:strand:+ start:300 stop:2066 length:1767 start_codon:yes stop_codon:yes gene_type:complete
MAKFDLVVAAKTVGAGSIKRLGNSMQGVAGRVKNLRLAMGGLNKTFATFGLIISGGAFVGLVKGAIDSADAFGKMSDQTGIAANTLQAYVNAGKLAGVSQETIDKGLRRLAQSMREADQGVATYKDSFDALGISVRTVDGQFKTNQQVLGEVADKFATMENGATKAAIAMEIFGRSGASLINLLNGGAASLEEFNYEVSDNFAQNAEFFNDQIAVLAIRFDGFRKQLTDALLPALNTIVGVFSELFSAENDFSGFFKAIEIGIRGISIGIYGTIKLVDEVVRVIGNLGKRFKNFFDNLVAGIPPFILKMIGGVGNAAKDLGGAFIDQQKTNFSSLMGEDFMVGFKERLEGNFAKINELFSGETNAPATYFQNIDKAAGDAGETIEKSFGATMKEKLNSFKDSIKTVGESMADVVIKGVKGMEDALVTFVTTGKLSFRSLANSIIADMARIAIQQSITKPLMGFLGNMFGGGSAKGNVFNQQGLVEAYAKGGVVNKPTYFAMGGSGKFGIMGEKGSEAILPLRRGSNGKLGVEASGGGSTNVVVNVDASGSNVEGDEASGRQLGQLIASAVQGEILKQQRPGGLLAGTA